MGFIKATKRETILDLINVHTVRMRKEEETIRRMIDEKIDDDMSYFIHDSCAIHEGLIIEGLKLLLKEVDSSV
jgi:hypothetical protein